MNSIMKIVKSLEESGLSIKGVSETINNEAKKQRGGFLACYYVHYVLVNLSNLLTV